MSQFQIVHFVNFEVKVQRKGPDDKNWSHLAGFADLDDAFSYCGKGLNLTYINVIEKTMGTKATGWKTKRKYRRKLVDTLQ